MKVSILHFGKNKGNSELRWLLNVMKTKMKGRRHPGYVIALFYHGVLDKFQMKHLLLLGLFTVRNLWPKWLFPPIFHKVLHVHCEVRENHSFNLENLCAQYFDPKVFEHKMVYGFLV